MALVSDTGLQGAEPGAGPVHQAQKRLGRYPVGGQQVHATQQLDRAVQMDQRKGITTVFERCCGVAVTALGGGQ